MVTAMTTIEVHKTPKTGTGAWTVIAGSATVTTPSSPTSGVTGLIVGANTFVWTISNGTCPSSSDTVTIMRDESPTTAAAGLDQTVCATTATLAGNTPTVGTGAWTVIAGSATVTTPSSPTSGVTSLSVGANTFVWTITNVFAPTDKLVTPEVGELGVVTVALPAITVHAPVPTVGVLPARVAVVAHTSWSDPAFAVVGDSSRMIVTVSLD